MINRQEFEEEYADEIEELEEQMMLTAIGIEKFYEALQLTNIPKEIIEKLILNKSNKEEGK